MQKKATKLQQARVTLDDYAIDGFSVEFSIETGKHCYDVRATWSEWDGWDATVEDGLGNELSADALAHRLGYEDRSDLLSNLTDGMFLPGDRRFALFVKAGA